MAVIGASTGIPGLLLIFVGFLLAASSSFPPGTPKAVKGRHVTVARWAFVPFTGAVIVLLAAYFWLFHDDSVWLLKLWSQVFVALCICVVTYAIYVGSRQWV